MPVIAPATGMLSSLLGRKSAGAGALTSIDGIAGLPDELISALENPGQFGPNLGSRAFSSESLPRT